MVGRSAELKYLQQNFEQEGNQLLVLYGRSGIGKGTLLKEFCQDKKMMYFAARHASPKQQRQMMGEEIQNQYSIKISDFTYENFFSRIRSGDSSKLVLVIEGFEKIAKKEPAFIEAIGKLKSRKLYPGSVMIILSSSALAWVETEMLQCFGAHAKKITDVYKIKELKFVDVVHLFPDYSVSQCVQVYGVLGGIPGFLDIWDSREDIRGNICRHILSRGGLLYEEAERYIGTQLRELSVYDTILAAVATGSRKLNNLFEKTEFSRAKISVYLKNLIEFEVVEKVYSFETGGWENTQKGLYQIKSTFINFWFKFVYPHLSQLHILSAEEFYDRYVVKELEEYLNRYFIQVCMEYLELMSLVNQLPIKIYKIGTWVGKQGNIDIVAQNSVRENIIGMCNWSEDKMTYEMYEKLLSCMTYAKIKAKSFYLFSAKDFDDEIKAAAQKNRQIVLIDRNRL